MSWLNTFNNFIFLCKAGFKEINKCFIFDVSIMNLFPHRKTNVIKVVSLLHASGKEERKKKASNLLGKKLRRSQRYVKYIAICIVKGKAWKID